METILGLLKNLIGAFFENLSTDFLVPISREAVLHDGTFVGQPHRICIDLEWRKNF